jgi:hypothetical protein
MFVEFPTRYEILGVTSGKNWQPYTEDKYVATGFHSPTWVTIKIPLNKFLSGGNPMGLFQATNKFRLYIDLRDLPSGTAQLDQCFDNFRFQF